MQRYKIIHHTYYNYSEIVTLGAQSLLLRPREDYELRIESFALKITPDATLLWHRDIEGNSVAIANFALPTRQLLIESEVIIQQYNESPLDFLVSDYALLYPFAYQNEEAILLSAYRALPDHETINVVDKWIANFWHPGKKFKPICYCSRLPNTLIEPSRIESGKNLGYRAPLKPSLAVPDHAVTLPFFLWKRCDV
jgi:hypothetical protein